MLCRYMLMAVILVAAFAVSARAQFREEAFTQSYVDPSDTTGRDTTDVMFSFKEYFKGLRHEEDPRIGVLTAGSALFIGGSQIYNKQYWKLPVIYGGIAAGVGGGFVYRMKYKKEGSEEFKKMSNWFFGGAGLVYWASLMDGAVNFRKEIPHQSGKATLYSLLLPGLGQAYNGEFWKIPIYYGVMAGSIHFYLDNSKSYKRYQWIYKQATENPEYNGPIQESTALYYRNIFRRYRDYSIVAIAASYLLQVIDANVFAYMTDFDLGDDLSMNISPTVITNEPVRVHNPYEFAFHPTGQLNGTSLVQSSLGMRLGFTF